MTSWVVDVDHEDPTVPDEHLELPYSYAWGGPYDLSSNAYADDGILWYTNMYQVPAAQFGEGHYVFSAEGDGLRLSLSWGNNACVIDQATVDIADIDFVGPDDLVSLLDMGMDAHCRANYGQTVHARARFRDRDDLTPPGGVTGVSATRNGDQVVLHWTNPDAADFAGVIIRSYSGDIAPGAPDAGEALYLGSGTSTAFAAAGQGEMALAIWTYDHTGNVGKPHELQVGAP